MKEIYVDGACCHQRGQGSWAVIIDDENYTGGLNKKDINSEYCELFAIREALSISYNYADDIVIFTDNNVAENLNKTNIDFKRRLKKKGRGRKKNKFLLSKVYDTYHSLPNVKIKKISRKNNKMADRLAKRTLRRMKNNKEGYNE